MGLFSFLGSQAWEVLEWKDESKDVLVHRFDMQGKEIMKGSQLTVRESQVAVFVNEGKIADVFNPGRYKLDASNIPILSAIGSIWYRGNSRFKSELYFVNTKQFPNQKWGTKNPVTLRDNEFGMVRIKAFGNFSFKVKDAAVFMKELFGTNSTFKVEDISDQLRSLVISQLSDTIAESRISALDLSSNYQEFGDMVKAHAVEKFSAIGLELTDINVENINFPENVEKAIDERTSLGILGNTMGLYTQKKAADAMGDAAKNTGTVGAVFGMGVASNLGGVMAGATSQPQPAEKVEEPKSKFCAECGAKIALDAKFCAECGAKQSVEGKCVKCGATVKKGAKFCPECGAKL